MLGSPLPNPRFSAEAGSPSWSSRLWSSRANHPPRRPVAVDKVGSEWLATHRLKSLHRPLVCRPGLSGTVSESACWAIGGRWLAVLSDLQPAACFLPNPASPSPSFLWGIPGLQYGKAARVAARRWATQATPPATRKRHGRQRTDRRTRRHARLFSTPRLGIPRVASTSHCQDPHPAILGRCGGREWCGRWAMIERPPLPTSSSPSSHSPKRPRAWGKGIPRTKLPTSLSHLDLPRMYTCYFVTLNLISPLSPHSYDPVPLSPTTSVSHRTRLSSSPSRLPPLASTTTYNHPSTVTTDRVVRVLEPENPVSFESAWRRRFPEYDCLPRPTLPLREPRASLHLHTIRGRQRGTKPPLPGQTIAAAPRPPPSAPYLSWLSRILFFHFSYSASSWHLTCPLLFPSLLLRAGPRIYPETTACWAINGNCLITPHPEVS